MDRSKGEREPGSTGFAATRREVLKTGGAVGTGMAMAGCGMDFGFGSSDSSSPADRPSEPVGAGELVDDGLTVLSSGFVEDPRRLELQDQVDREIQTARYVRVRVRNDIDGDIGAVTLSVDFYDDQDRFLEIQMATISQLRSREVFEGYIPVGHPNSSTYLIRARRSRRGGESTALSAVSATHHCLADETVRGTVTNDGDDTVTRLDVRVRYLDEDGEVLGTAFNTLSELDAGESRDFDVGLDDSLDGTTARVADYTVDVGDYSGARSAAR